MRDVEGGEGSREMWRKVKSRGSCGGWRRVDGAVEGCGGESKELWRVESRRSYEEWRSERFPRPVRLGLTSIGSMWRRCPRERGAPCLARPAFSPRGVWDGMAHDSRAGSGEVNDIQGLTAAEDRYRRLLEARIGAQLYQLSAIGSSWSNSWTLDSA